MSIISSMNNRKGAYGEVEQIKNSKFQIKRDHQLVALSVGVLVVGLSIFIFFGDLPIYALFYSPINFFLGDSANGLVGEAYLEKKLFLDNYPNFFIFLITILYMTSGFFLTRLYPDSRSKSWLNKALRIFFYPSGVIFRIINTWFQMPKDLVPKIGLDNAWLEKLNRDFFHQVVEKSDGYARASSLTIFYDMPYILGKEAYLSMSRLFKSDESLKDLLIIIEGYLQQSKLYDELWIGNNDVVDVLGENTPQHKLYDNFKAYKLRYDQEQDLYKDVVVFSRNALKIFVQKHTRIFYFFLDRKIFKEDIIKVADDDSYFLSLNSLRDDISFRKKVHKYFGNKKASSFFACFDNSKTLLTNENGREILFELLTTDFMFIAFRSVMERYMGLPAGLLVSKLEDYDTRMIIETYKRRSLVKIIPTKNDGSTAQYNSDNYTNLFLMLLYAYFNESENNFFQELQDKFNTDIGEKPQKEIY